MNSTKEISNGTLGLFEPDPDVVYTIEATSHLAQVPRRTILVYYKHGLVAPAVDPESGGYYFNDEAIRRLRRIEFLRAGCGVNLLGTRMILELLREVERLRDEVRFLRR